MKAIYRSLLLAPLFLLTACSGGEQAAAPAPTATPASAAAPATNPISQQNVFSPEVMALQQAREAKKQLEEGAEKQREYVEENSK